jgi:hypothetical protein
MKVALGFGVAAFLVLGAGSARAGSAADLLAELHPPGERFGLSAPAAEPDAASLEGGATPSSDARGPTPFLAGLMSAVVPGTGQLVQGQTRGWAYLGIEVAAWFSYFALRDAAAQSEEDYREFADEYWLWDLYQTGRSCPEGGPRNFDEEEARLRDLYETDRDQYYVEIGRDEVYACGWDSTQAGARSAYNDMRTEANNLYNASGVVVGVIVLNHVVSAVDAARSASRRRKAETAHAWNWHVRPNRRGVDLRVELSRTF